MGRKSARPEGYSWSYRTDSRASGASQEEVRETVAEVLERYHPRYVTSLASQAADPRQKQDGHQRAHMEHMIST